MRISDWSSDVCSSDLKVRLDAALAVAVALGFHRQDARPPQGSRVFSWELPAPSPAFAGGGARSSRLKPLLQGTRHARGEFLRRHAAIPDCHATPPRPEARRVGKGCVSTFNSWWSPSY